MYSLDCSYYDKSFDTIQELVDSVISSGMDPSYEITKNGVGIGEELTDFIVHQMNRWKYREMGSRNKKTGKLSYYNVTVIDYHISDCECKAREFRPYSPCKHMKRLKEKCSHLSI